MGPGRFRPEADQPWVGAHPDTGVRFAGKVIPEWDRICDVVCEAATMAPGLRALGWDVVLSDKGPRIVEVNAEWDLQMMQAMGRGVLGTEVTELWQSLGADPPDGSLAWRWKHRRRLIPRLLRAASRRLNG